MIHKNKQDLKLKLIIFISALIVACIVRFSVSDTRLENAVLLKIWLGISFISGIAGIVIYRKSFLFAGLIATAGFACAIVLRIVFDLIFIDSTSLKLFTIQLVTWSILAFIPALAGAFLGNMIILLTKRDRVEKKVKKKALKV